MRQLPQLIGLRSSCCWSVVVPVANYYYHHHYSYCSADTTSTVNRATNSPIHMFISVAYTTAEWVRYTDSVLFISVTVAE